MLFILIYIFLFQFKVYREIILSSELLFSEDCAFIETYTETVNSSSRISYFSKLTIPMFGMSALYFKPAGLKILFGSLWSLAICWELYSVTIRRKTLKIISDLIEALKRFTKLIRKYLCMIIQYSATLNYYTSDANKSSLNERLSDFTKAYYHLLKNVIDMLQQKSLDLLCCVPLTTEVVPVENVNFDEDIKVKDLKVMK